jgi:hypothetical protein
MPNDHTGSPGGSSAATGRSIPVPRELSASARDAVRERARSLLETARRRNPGWAPPPFDPRVLARVLGIPIHYQDGLGSVDALIVCRGGTFHILANRGVAHPGRLNFTLAHELVHTFFEGAGAQIHLRARDRRAYERTPEGPILERLCDLGASELLMPSPHFEQAAGELGFTAVAAPRLAERFETSLEATALRLVRWNAGTPCAFGLFEYALRPSAPDPSSGAAGSEIARYRVRRVFRSAAFPFIFPEGKSVPRESAIYRASLGREMLAAREPFALGAQRATLRVSAFPLHRGESVEEPPLVCAAFTAE